MKTITILLIFTASIVNAQRNAPPPHSRMLIKPQTKLISTASKSPLESPNVQNKLFSLFKSSNAKSRLVGYKAVRDKFKAGELKADDRRLYRVLISKAADYHLGELKSHVEELAAGAPAAQDEGTGMLKTFNKNYGDWYLSALGCRQMVQTDWRRVQQYGSFEGMQKEFKECFDFFPKMVKSWEAIRDSSDYLVLYETCNAINECRAEASWCDGEDDYEKTPITRMVTAVPAGVSLKRSLERIESFDKQIKDYAEASSYNEKQLWASAEIKQTVQMINDKRFKIGLVCYKLDEILSRVCTEHSHDMVKREFFSHKGSNGKDYEERVRDADWYGGTFGEVLHAGSIIPRDVHNVWWKSEDSRPKLYTPHLDRIGIGIINKIWTVVVGSAYSGPNKHYIVE